MRVDGVIDVGAVCQCITAVVLSSALYAEEPCKVTIVERDSGWPVPLVELRTTHHVRYVSDNAGVIAIDDPSLMNHEVWFDIIGHGYGVEADGFGKRGIRLTPQPGESLTVKVTRSSLAKRIGRLTGAGLFDESQKLGEKTNWHDSPVFGCDSVQLARHRGKLFWAWGDTKVAGYPLGIFHMTSATTGLEPFESFEPPLRPEFDYFLDEKEQPRGVARMPGEGPTWITGYVSLPDKTGAEHLVAVYRKITPPLTAYETGLCVWNDETEAFEHLRTLWSKSEGGTPPLLVVDGQPALWTDEQGNRRLLFGNPLPRVQLPATFEAWQDPSQWQPLSPQQTIQSAHNGSEITPHSGSIVYNAYRQRWVSVFVQAFGEPSMLGILWYAEADSPTGRWGPAVKILSHDNYTFYNPRLHTEITPPSAPFLLFEGTYTAAFANHAEPTPRYDYNQILYRLDLDDPALLAAHRR
jgi:hypothetical protein